MQEAFSPAHTTNHTAAMVGGAVLSSSSININTDGGCGGGSDTFGPGLVSSSACNADTYWKDKHDRVRREGLMPLAPNGTWNAEGCAL